MASTIATAGTGRPMGDALTALFCGVRLKSPTIQSAIANARNGDNADTEPSGEFTSRDIPAFVDFACLLAGQSTVRPLIAQQDLSCVLLLLFTRFPLKVPRAIVMFLS